VYAIRIIGSTAPYSAHGQPGIFPADTGA
jgi:hypothetical protein